MASSGTPTYVFPRNCIRIAQLRPAVTWGARDLDLMFLIKLTPPFDRFRRKGVHSRHMTTHSWTGWLTWIGICTAIWALAFVIAEV